MTNSDKFTPSPEEAEKVQKIVGILRDDMSETADFAGRILKSFKELNGIGSKNNADLKKAEDFTKKILSNAEARAKLQGAALSLEKNLQDQILKLEMARFDSELNKQLVADKTKELEEKAAKTMEKELALIQEAKDITEQVMDLRGTIKDIENEILAATKEKERLEKNTANREEALTKAVAAQKINETAISENLAKQDSIKSKLLAVEKEITAAQSDSLGYSHDYEVLLKKQSYLKNSLTGLEKVGTGYLNDRLRLETRSEKIRKELEISVENENRVQRELYDMQSKLVDEKQKEADLTKQMNKAQADAEKLQTERLGLEKRIKEIQDSGLSGEEIDLMVKALNTKIKENQEAQKAAKYQAGFKNYLKDSAESSGGTLGNIAGMANKAKDFADKFKTVPASFLILLTLIKEGLDLFVKLDKAAEDFRKETGFSNTQMTELRKNAEAVNRDFQKMGVSIEDVYKSAKALTDVFGRTSLISKETLGNVSLLAVNLGVAEADSAGVLANFQGLGGATEKAAMNVVKVGAGISEKAGVPFKLVMNDIANASSDTLNLLGATPSKLMKSAIAARALGTDINKIAATQQKLLNYSSSITSELEASALLGKSISFQKARQLAYDGDAIGAAKATLDTIKKAGDFNKMTVYQKKALAEASGMELKDITKMMAVEKQRDAILLNGTEEQKKKLLAQEAELENLKKMADLDNEDLVKQNEKAIMQQKMQGLTKQLSNLWDAIMLSVGSALEPIIRVVVAVLIPAFKIVAALVEGALAPFREFYDLIEDAVGGSEDMAKYINYVKDAVDSYLVPAFKALAAPLVFVVDGVAAVGKAIGAIFGGIMYMFTGEGSIWERIVAGAEAIGDGLLEALQFPFIRTWEWLKKTFMGQSPSELGLSIVDGIKAVGSMLLGVITSPFRMAWNFISDLFIGGGSVGDMIVDGIKAIGSFVLNTLTWPFRTAMNFIGDIFNFEKLGDSIIETIASIAGSIFDTLTYPFRAVYKFISGLFGGGDMGSGILDGIKSVASGIFKTLTAPFSLVMGMIDFIFGEGGKIPEIISNGLSFVTNFLSGVLKGIQKVGQFIVSAFKFAGGFVMNIVKGFGNIGEIIIDGIKFAAGFIVDILFMPFRLAYNLISTIFSSDGDLVDTILEGIKSAAIMVFDVLIYPFKMAIGFVGMLFEGGGEFIPKLLDGIKSAASSIFDVLTYPFRNIINFVSGLFGGDGQLGTTIIEGIKNVASLIFDIIVSPFKKALDFVKGLPLVGKLFGGADDISKQASPAPSIQSSQTSNVIEVNHLDELRDVVMELTTAVANLGTSVTTTPVAGTKLDTSGLEAKLDNLTQLLVGGAVRVYLDGKDVSAAMSSTGR